MRLSTDFMYKATGSGRFKWLSTGSDACAEHECGIKPLLTHLCAGNDPDIVRRVAETPIADVLSGELQLPDFVETRRINSSLLQFTEHGKWLVFGVFRPEYLELMVRREEASKPHSRWHDRGFAILWPKTEPLQYQQVQFAASRNSLLFASHFVTDRTTGGIVLGSEPALDLHKRRRTELQALYARQLLVESRVPVAQELMRSDSSVFGYLWPVLVDDRDVAYALNPSFGVNADYYGPYTEDQLRRWIARGRKDRLTRNY